MPVFMQLVDKLTQNASATTGNQIPLNQWVEQILVVLQCLGLLVRNPPKKKSCPPVSGSGNIMRIFNK